MNKDEKKVLEEEDKWIEVEVDPEVVVKAVPKKGPTYSRIGSGSLFIVDEDDESF